MNMQEKFNHNFDLTLDLLKTSLNESIKVKGLDWHIENYKTPFHLIKDLTQGFITMYDKENVFFNKNLSELVSDANVMEDDCD